LGLDIGQALRGIKWDGEFYESDTLFLDDNQIWSSTCVENVRWNSIWGVVYHSKGWQVN